MQSEAGDPAASAPNIFQARDAAPRFPCHTDADFHDADFLAAPASASRRRHRRRSRVVRPALRHRAPDAVGDAACESKTVRVATEVRAAHKNGNWSNDSLQAAMDAVTDDGMSLRQASRVFGVPSTSIRDHLYGKTRGRQRGIPPTLNSHEEKKNCRLRFQNAIVGSPSYSHAATSQSSSSHSREIHTLEWIWGPWERVAWMLQT